MSALPGQLVLPLGAAPASVRGHGLRAAHVWPRVGRRTRKGGFWSGRVPARHAWAYPYLETTDAGATWATLTYDCDNRQAMASGLSELPPWNWFVETTRGAHVTWALAVPVAKHAAARAAPETYLSHVAEYYHAALGADPAFNGCSEETLRILTPRCCGARQGPTRWASCHPSYRSTGASRASPRLASAATATCSCRGYGALRRTGTWRR